MTNCKDCTTNCVYRGKDNEARCRSFAGTVTNAHRIRAMSDEELANIVVCPHCKTNWDKCTDDCFTCRLEWLKQSAE